MNKQVGYFFLIIHIFFFGPIFSQETTKKKQPEAVSQLFLEEASLPIKLCYSNKEIKKNTNDSTYIKSSLVYEINEGEWDSLKVELRARGDNRLKNCYFAPIKVSIKKSDAKNTVFEGNKKLKLVLPCLIQRDNNDNVMKEYLAYKFYEIISPYHFKTRLVDISLEEIKGKKVKPHDLRGFLIEDDKNVARRFAGKVYDRDVHPMQQEAIVSVRNAFFQFMIGNTDFSQMYQHNIKLLFVEKNMIPVPYDFDMSGFTNCSYAVVSEIGNEQLAMTSVTQRKYRGFKRGNALLEQVRQEFLSNKSKFEAILSSSSYLFDDERELKTAKEFISGFFAVLANEKKFNSEILNAARVN